jgi:glycolate oxidase FAD binding subunit
LKTLEPTNIEQAAEMLRDANDRGMAVVPRGAGTKHEWGNPPSRCDVVLSLAKMNRVLEHAWADLTVTVEAGCAVADLQKTLATHGQRLAADPWLPEKATVGGILSANDTGALRYRYGGLRDLIIGATLVLADGTIAKSGGKVVKNVAGYDLPKLVTGAMGTLGVIASATFRLHPLPQNAQTVTIAAGDLRSAQKIVARILDSQLVPAAVQLRHASGKHPRIDVQFEGTLAGIAAQLRTLREIAPAVESSAAVWTRAEADAKLSVLPTQIADTLEPFEGEAVMQATGIGWLRGCDSLEELRARAERSGGSLVLLKRREKMNAWGHAGDSLPVMRAVKQQFDPRGTLNPGSYLGGI